MNNFFIKVKSSTFYTICSLKKHRRNISLIKVKYWKNVLLLIKYYWCIASRLSRSSQNSRKNIFLSSRSDGRADIHLLVVIFVMNELWVTETHCLGYFSSMDICIFVSPCQFDIASCPAGLQAWRGCGNPSLANLDFIYQESNEQFLSPCSLSTYHKLDFLRHECSIYDASHSHPISLSLYQGPSLSVDLEMVKGIKTGLFARPDIPRSLLIQH